MEIAQPNGINIGGHLAFGPKDGFLYIAFGSSDQISANINNAQDLTNLYGSIIRININNDPYSIPADNPFVGEYYKRPEIFCYGLKNPWRFSFDKVTNDLIIADISQESWEEVNWNNWTNSKGANFGWNIMEGNHVFLDQEPDKFIELNELDLINPSIEYSSNANYGKTLAGFKQSINAIGCSITGGYVYRGHEIDEIKGHYFFADYCTGKIWSIKNFTSENYEIIDWTDDLLEKKKKQIYISSFAEDSKKNLYILDHSGSIFKIINEKR